MALETGMTKLSSWIGAASTAVALLAGLYHDLDFVIPMVPPEHPGALWPHWGEPAIHWFHGGHLARFGRAGIIDAVVRHLERLGIL